MFQSFIVAVLLIYALLFLCNWLFSPKKVSALQAAELRLETVNSKNFFLAEELGETKRSLKLQEERSLVITQELVKITEQFEKLRFAKISGDVKLGQKAEHLLPFLEAFPYKDDEIKGLFQPIDLIVFRQDEVVFVEIKTGAASLTDKERRIRDNIKAGRVRFEVHRLNEKGVTVK